jgi:hypothetical protein
LAPGDEAQASPDWPRESGRFSPLESPEPMPGTKKCSNFQEDRFNSEGADFISKTKTALRDVNSLA